jgi:hypothetical protein
MPEILRSSLDASELCLVPRTSDLAIQAPANSERTKRHSALLNRWALQKSAPNAVVQVVFFWFAPSGFGGRRRIAGLPVAANSPQSLEAR